MLVPVTVTGIERRRQPGRSPSASADPLPQGPADTLPGPTTSTLGLLDPAGRRPFTIHRWPAPDDLREHVERFWTVAWDVAPGQVRYSSLLPHPCVNLVVDEHARAWVAGCGREVFRYPLTGRGAVLGVKFRAGAFRAFLGRDVATITEVTLPAGQVFAGVEELQDALAPLVVRVADELRGPRPAEGAALPATLAEAPTPAAAEATAVLVSWLRRHTPASGAAAGATATAEREAARAAGRAVHALLTDPRVHRVCDAAALVGVPPRTLQRLFRRHVGVTAQDVLRRGRMHLAAERVADAVTAGRSPDWAALAADLGFADQPHFIREFRATLGQTPSAYAADLARR